MSTARQTTSTPLVSPPAPIRTTAQDLAMPPARPAAAGFPGGAPLGPPVVCAPLAAEKLALSVLEGVPIVRTGMGPDRAAATAARLAREPTGPRGRPVLVAGVAGALAPGLGAGDLVVADQIRFAGRAAPGIAVPTAAPLAAALRALGLRVHVGPILCAERVVDGAQRVELARSGALAVDMESGWLAPAAAGGPFAVVRAVVDGPETPLARPGTAARGWHALRSLRRAVPALRAWFDAIGERTIDLAEPRSFCAGVERAIDIVDRALERYGAPVFVRRQIVHNAHVVRELAGRGAVFVQEIDEIPEGSTVVLAAHGVSPAVRAQAEARALTVIDATCPLVAKVHAEVKRHAGYGKTVFLIGHADHEEVEGTYGEAPTQIVVVEDEAAAWRVRAADPEQVAYAMQTTLATDEAERIAAVLRERFPAISAPRSDDICYATTNRQHAIRAVAAGADLVLVVGSPNSSNSRRLAEVATRAGAPGRLLDNADELDLRWLAGVRRIGISAGASAPQELVDELVTCLSGFGPVAVNTTRTGIEDIRFTLPKEVS